jgi:hypothetical protein
MTLITAKTSKTRNNNGRRKYRHKTELIVTVAEVASIAHPSRQKVLANLIERYESSRQTRRYWSADAEGFRKPVPMRKDDVEAAIKYLNKELDILSPVC